MESAGLYDGSQACKRALRCLRLCADDYEEADTAEARQTGYRQMMELARVAPE